MKDTRFVRFVIFVSASVPLVLLLHDTYYHRLGANPTEFAIRTTGTLALLFLIIALAVTPLRKSLGQPWMIKLRRMLGLFAFFYAVVHFTVYLVLDLELNFRLLGADILKRPYITIGFSALLLLLPLALTSTNGMMRRLGRRWQSLHRLIYPIAALAVWHFYWQVKRDVREPLLYVGILALLLAYRALRWRARRAPRPARATPAIAPVTSRSGSATAPERT